MTRLWEGKHAGSFIVSEATSNSGTSFGRSRETVTIQASAGDMKVGQVVTNTGGVWTIYADTDTPAGILFDAVPDSTATQEAVLIARDAEVNASEIEWDSALTTAQVKTGVAELAKLGIIVREVV